MRTIRQPFGTLSRRLLNYPGSGGSFWALSDQCAVSLGNFLTQVLLARELARVDYGIFGLIFGVILLLNFCHVALITYPLSAKGAVEEPEGVRRVTSASLLLTVLLAIPSSAVVLAACLILRRPDLALWAVGALLFWQLQETVRRALMSCLRYSDALWGDGVGYLGQAAFIAVLAHRGQLTLASGFASVALSSAVGGTLQALQLGLTMPIRFREALSYCREFWRLGRWALLTNAANASTNLAFPWMLALLRGPQEAAPLQAIWNVVGLTHPIKYSVNNLVVPTAARARREENIRAALRRARSHAILGAALLVPCCAVLTIWPRRVLISFYGHGSAYLMFGNALRLLALAYFVDYSAGVLTAFLNGLERPRDACFAQLAGAAAAVAPGLPLATGGGVSGACLGFLAVSTVRTVTAATSVRKLLETSHTNDLHPGKHTRICEQKEGVGPVASSVVLHGPSSARVDSKEAGEHVA